MALIQAAGAHNTAMGIGSETSVGGRYRLERQIGVGATARVWLAFDAVLERRVAVKMLDSPIGGEAAHIERFRREARAVAKVQHPHIVTVLDSGEHDGMPFIVLEYVEGETLKERIRRVGRLTVTEAVAFAIEVARALEAAHARGIVHRDVKPQNILLDAEGGAKVTDFGIARSGNEDGLTLGGRVLGTTDYISPEQALGHEVTGQSDLYSLGVVLYESLTGAVPFTGTSHIAVATMHVREDMPDVQRRRPEVSAALAAIVERATAKHLALRYGGARELIADLEEVLAIETARTGNAGREATVVLRSLPPSATNQLPMRVKHPVAMIISAALALAAAAAVAAFLLTRTHGGTPAPANLPRSVGEASVSLAQGAAHQYNPFGTTPEDPTRVGQAIDGNAATFWQTSTYQGARLGKSGVGLYVDAAPHVAANQAVIQTQTPGFHAQIWGADHIVPVTYSPLPRPGITPAQLGWTLLADNVPVAGTTKIALRNVRQRRYYLLWITDLGPDPGGAARYVQIAEFTLSRARG
jgi:eukaryotic-like serine/threonine-protein kinase